MIRTMLWLVAALAVFSTPLPGIRTTPIPFTAPWPTPSTAHTSAGVAKAKKTKVGKNTPTGIVAIDPDNPLDNFDIIPNGHGYARCCPSNAPVDVVCLCGKGGGGSGVSRYAARPWERGTLRALAKNTAVSSHTRKRARDALAAWNFDWVTLGTLEELKLEVEAARLQQQQHEETGASHSNGDSHRNKAAPKPAPQAERTVSTTTLPSSHKSPPRLGSPKGKEPKIARTEEEARKIARLNCRQKANSFKMEQRFAKQQRVVEKLEVKASAESNMTTMSVAEEKAKADAETNRLEAEEREIVFKDLWEMERIERVPKREFIGLATSNWGNRAFQWRATYDAMGGGVSPNDEAVHKNSELEEEEEVGEIEIQADNENDGGYGDEQRRHLLEGEDVVNDDNDGSAQTEDGLQDAAGAMQDENDGSAQTEDGLQDAGAMQRGEEPDDNASKLNATMASSNSSSVATKTPKVKITTTLSLTMDPERVFRDCIRSNMEEWKHRMASIRRTELANGEELHLPPGIKAQLLSVNDLPYLTPEQRRSYYDSLVAKVDGEKAKQQEQRSVSGEEEAPDAPAPPLPGANAAAAAVHAKSEELEKEANVRAKAEMRSNARRAKQTESAAQTRKAYHEKRLMQCAQIFLPANATDESGALLDTTPAYENCVQEAEADRIDAEREAAKKDAEVEARRKARKKEEEAKMDAMQLALVANKARSGAIAQTTLAYQQRIKRTVGRRGGAADPIGIAAARDAMDPAALAVAAALRGAALDKAHRPDKSSGSKSYFAKAGLDDAVAEALSGD